MDVDWVIGVGPDNWEFFVEDIPMEYVVTDTPWEWEIGNDS